MADYKINKNTFEVAVAETAARLMKDKFLSRNFINGSEINSFTPFPQINLFVLYEIFEEWRAQMKSLEHPYFDYTKTNIKSAMDDFLNALSENIRIKKNDFERLLKISVSNTLSLLLEPENFLKEFFFGKHLQISRENFREKMNYISELRLPVQTFFAWMEKNNIEITTPQVFQEKIHKAFELLKEKLPDVLSIFKNITGQDAVQSGVVILPAEKKETSTPSLKIAEEKTFLEKIREQTAESQTLHQKFSSDKNSNDLSQMIPLNMHFRFAEKLFKNNQDAYRGTLNRLNSFETLDVALDYIKLHVIINNGVSKDDETLREFVDVVAKKFRQ